MAIQVSHSQPGQFAAAIAKANPRARAAAAPPPPPGLPEQSAEAQDKQVAETLAKLMGHDGAPADRDS